MGCVDGSYGAATLQRDTGTPFPRPTMDTGKPFPRPSERTLGDFMILPERPPIELHNVFGSLQDNEIEDLEANGVYINPEDSDDDGISNVLVPGYDGTYHDVNEEIEEEFEVVPSSDDEDAIGDLCFSDDNDSDAEDDAEMSWLEEAQRAVSRRNASILSNHY